MGIRKGGLIDFISPELAIDETSPVQSSMILIQKLLKREVLFQQIDISGFSYSQWEKKSRKSLCVLSENTPRT